MMEDAGKHRRVILRRCDEYDVDRLRGIVREGFEDLGVEPTGRILVKPNVVTANKDYIHHSFTEPRLVEALVDVLRAGDAGAEITLGECGGIGIPTRLFFQESGYCALARRLGVPLVDFDEQQAVEVPLERAKWHRTVLLAKALYEAQFKIWMPKLKFHIVAQITNALKLNIGILQHRERFLFHDDRLNAKIVDLLEAGFPDVIVTDAVTSGRGFESSPYPWHLGAVMIADDPLASDVVAAHMLNYDPRDVVHLVEAHERGYGSLDLDEIEVTGDITIEELAARSRDIDSPFQELRELDSPLAFYEGNNRETGQVCYGGCICSIKGALGTAEKRFPGNLDGACKGAIVMGHYPGDVLHPGEPVAIIGSCAGVEGRLEAGRVIRIRGCPVKVKDLMIFMLHRFRMRSPAFELKNLLKLAWYSLVKGLMRLTRRFRQRARITHPPQLPPRSPDQG